MIQVSEQFLGKGAAYKAVYMLDQLEKMELARRAKEVVAMAGDRESADNLKQYVIDEMEAFDHVNTGKLQNSVGVRNLGNGEYGITMEEYGVYVNGYDREAMGEGFIDVAVNQALIDGDDVEILI
jgi:hypothetical protein